MNSQLKAVQDIEHKVQQKTQLTKPISKGYNYYNLFIIRRLAEITLGGIFVYIGLSFLILSQFTLTPWPAAGVALTVIFLRGYYASIGILLGALAAYYFNTQLFIFSVLQASLFLIYILCIRMLGLRWIGAIQPISKISTLLKFISLIAIATFLYTLCHTLIVLIFRLPWSYTIAKFILDFFAQLNGILCLTPLTLMIDPFSPKHYFKFNAKNLTWWCFAFIILISHIIIITLPLNIPSFIFIMGLFISNTLFAILFKQIPVGFLFLGLGFLYMAGLLDFAESCFKAPIFAAIYLTVSYMACMSIATARTNEQKY